MTFNKLNETKPWYKSTTVQGAIVTLLSVIVEVINLNITASEVATVATSGLAIVGVAVTVWGRHKTKGEKLTLK